MFFCGHYLKRATSLGLILSSFIFPPELLRQPHPVGAGLALCFGERLRSALTEFTQCFCVLVHSRRVNKARGLSTKRIASHLPAPASLPSRPCPVVGHPQHPARPRAHRHHGCVLCHLWRVLTRFWWGWARERRLGHGLPFFLASRSNTAAITHAGGTRRSASMS